MRLFAELSKGCFQASFLLTLVRIFAPPPQASAPPDMHAFYASWLQPSWWLIVSLLIAALVLPWIPWIRPIARAATAARSELS